MKRVLLCALWALGSILLFAGGANATVYKFSCTGAISSPGELQQRLTGSAAWTTPAATMAKPVSGDVVQVDGTTNSAHCIGDIFWNTSGVTFESHTGVSFVATDVIDGMFEVAGAHITIGGLSLTCSTCSSSTASNTGVIGAFSEDGALVIHDGAVVLLENADIIGSQTAGVFATRGSSLSATSADISANGQGGTTAPFSSGIFAESGSSVRLGLPTGTSGVTIAGNGKSGGGCPGFGILLTQSTSLDSFAATIGGAGTGSDDSSQNTCGQILLQTGSSARIEGTTITQTTATQSAIQAEASSSFITTTNPVPTATTISSGDGGAILLGGASSALLNASTLSSTGTGQSTVEVAANSTVVLAGGNSISNPTTGGIAFQVDHSSSVIQVPGAQFGFTAAADTVSGSAFVQVQSSMDLGIGLISAAPSINWTVPSGDCILIQQNSSFRLSGGVAIAGAPAAACSLNGGTVSTTIVIQQESNAFFNVGHGGTLAIR